MTKNSEYSQLMLESQQYDIVCLCKEAEYRVVVKKPLMLPVHWGKWAIVNLLCTHKFVKVTNRARRHQQRLSAEGEEYRSLSHTNCRKNFEKIHRHHRSMQKILTEVEDRKRQTCFSPVFHCNCKINKLKMDKSL